MNNKHLLKPKHSEEVVATSLGWAVKRTGELLVSVKGLDLLVAQPEVAVETKIEPILSQPTKIMGYYYSPYLTAIPEYKPAVEDKPEVEQPVKRKPGRPKKDPA